MIAGAFSDKLEGRKRCSSERGLVVIKLELEIWVVRLFFERNYSKNQYSVIVLNHF